MNRIAYFLIIFLIINSLWRPPAQAAPAQQTGEDGVYLAQAQALLAEMTPAQRVGQLFLVTFYGSDVNLGTPVADLVTNYNVGGVVILAQSDNIAAETLVPAQVLQLTDGLQRLALGLETPTDEPTEGGSQTPPTSSDGGTPIPLFVATAHEGDGYPNTNILSGLTQLPSPMAIGATWDPDNAAAVGFIAGTELSALGINMLLGPSLDILSATPPAVAGGTGVYSFGAHPYWVGQMGQAFVRGVHQGGDGRIAVVAQHFPGQGGSDRPVESEITTVRRSLNQLVNLDLAPFLAVANPVTPGAQVDGLLTSHIRYQDFQGNITPTSAPFSFDPQAVATLLTLSDLDAWRNGGGILISDSLGADAIKRFYDDTESEFPHRQVAKDAFLAGNDLLFLADFGPIGADDAAQIVTIQDTIDWFEEKYLTDQTFQQRVDESVLRILQLKLRLYGGVFAPNNVLRPTQSVPATLGEGSATIFDIAQDAITLVFPNSEELAARLPQPPSANDRIVIFTDVRSAQQCSTCPEQAYIGVNDLEQRILTLYGPGASEQILPGQISSHSFADLNDLLDSGTFPITLPPPVATPDGGDLPPDGTPPPGEAPTVTPAPTPTIPPAYFVQESLADATWIIFAALDMDPNRPDSLALKRFLAERPDLIRNSNVVVFAYNAPYFLDTTEITKLSAYYAVYSKIDPFIDTSVRALFQESPLSGALPVDVPGIGYTVAAATRPDPNQVIDLFIVQEDALQSPPSEAPLELFVGDTLTLRTGIIHDTNGFPVPDGTVVRFTQQDRIQGFFNVIGETTTRDGRAELAYLLEARTGQFRITASAGLATASQVVDLIIDEENTAAVIIISPTPQPTPRPTRTPLPITPTPTVTPPPATATSTPPILPTGGPSFIQIPILEAQWLLGLFSGLLLLIGAGLFLTRAETSLSRRLRVILWSLIGGLLLYILLVLELPGLEWLTANNAWVGFLAMSAGGATAMAVYSRWISP